MRKKSSYIILCGISFALFGCGTNLSISDSQSSQGALLKLLSVTNFGDSITCGYYASPADGTANIYSMEGYAGVMDADLSEPSQNLCRGGDQAADMTRLWVYPNATPALNAYQLYTVLIGTNDAAFCGSSTGCLANWSQAVNASLAWLALPPGDKVLANSANASGNWSADLSFGEATTSNGASLQFPVQQVVAGRSLYVAYRVFDEGAVNAGTAALMVDGLQVATLNAQVDTGKAILTHNGETDTIFLATVPLGAAGAHTVTVTTTSPNGAFFSVLWAGASTANYTAISGAPRILIGGVTASSDPTLESAVSVYDAQLTSLVAAFAADGLNIQIAPTASALNTATDLVDTVHPNNAGHEKLAQAFVNML